MNEMEIGGFGMGVSGIPPMDVERLRGRGMRLYLKQQLRSLEAQIAALSSLARDEASEVQGEKPFLEGEAARRRKWDKILELEYLEAMREALLDTLARL